MKEVYINFNALLLKKEAVCTVSLINEAAFAVIKPSENLDNFRVGINNALSDFILNVDADFVSIEKAVPMFGSTILYLTVKTYNDGDETTNTYLLTLVKIY